MNQNHRKRIFWTSDDVRLSETVSAPAPLVKVGKGSVLVTSGDKRATCRYIGSGSATSNTTVYLVFKPTRHIHFCAPTGTNNYA